MKKIILVALLIISFQLAIGKGVGLALSGGGARGLAHIGVLKVFDEENIKVDYISGTSSGAMIASLYACGYSALEIEAMVREMKWTELVAEKVDRNKKQINFKHWQDESSFSFRLYHNFIPMLPESITAGNAIINDLTELTWNCGDITDFDNLCIPLRITATDILTGEPEVFSKGHLQEAIFASFCFPTILKPFELNGTFYIDGGIRSNLPLEPLLATDADYLIGVKANSPLKEPDDINNIVDILEQTAGIAIQTNVDNSIKFCDLLILPDMQDIGMLDFKKIDEIIAAGEAAARQVLPALRELPKRESRKEKKQSIPDHFSFKDIRIEGNQYLKSREIKRYLDLKSNHSYTKAKIHQAFENAYNSDLFQLIYPVIEREDDRYVLMVKVKEKMRSYLKINPLYNLDDDISLLILGDFRNLLQSDSRLLCGFTVGENNQACLDYVKNFGDDYGFYFHLFPYLTEIPLYTYDAENMKTNSVQALEAGETSGIGFFFRRSLIVEFYNFAYQKKLYHDIGVEDLNDLYFNSYGAGAKLYFDTLDDLVFGMRGIKMLSKFSFASSESNRAKKYRQGLHKFELLHPLTNWMSVRYKFEYGSYFEEMVQYDPFYIGGMDSFLGLYAYSRSSSIYKINSFSLRINPLANLYFEPQVNNLKLGNSDNWEIDNDLEWGGGFTIGYKTPIGPIRTGLAIIEKGHVTGYLNIGYGLDVFEFSRR